MVIRRICAAYVACVLMTVSGVSVCARGPWPRPALQVELDAHGNLYVLDVFGSELVKLNPGGKILARWRSADVSGRRWSMLRGLAVSPKGYIYVSEGGGASVSMYSSKSGKFLARWLPTYDISSMATDDVGRLYGLSDSGVISIYSPRGQLKSALCPWKGGEPSASWSGLDLAVDSRGHVFELCEKVRGDQATRRIVEFDPSGRIVRSLGSAPRQSSFISGARRLAVGPRRILYLLGESEASAERIVKLDAAGNCVSQLPVGRRADAIAVDDRGYIYLGVAVNNVYKCDPTGRPIHHWYTK